MGNIACCILFFCSACLIVVIVLCLVQQTKYCTYQSGPIESLQRRILMDTSRKENRCITLPKLLHCTYHTKHKLPEKVHVGHRRYFQDYTVHIYDDAEGAELITRYFTPSVLKRYWELSGAHRADLLRYCILYIHGGVYADIKTEFIGDMSSLLAPIEKRATQGLVVLVHSTYSKNTIYNGILAASPRQDIFLMAIEHILDVPIYAWRSDYLIFVRGLYAIVNTQLGSIRPGFHHGLSSDFYFWEEIRVDSRACPDGLDRYGLCMFVCDYVEEKGYNIIKVRYADYPW